MWERPYLVRGSQEFPHPTRRLHLLNGGMGVAPADPGRKAACLFVSLVGIGFPSFGGCCLQVEYTSLFTVLDVAPWGQI